MDSKTSCVPADVWVEQRHAAKRSFGITAAGGRVKVSPGAAALIKQRFAQPARGSPRAVATCAAPYARLAWSAANTFSAVTGRSVMRTPTASSTALATAAAVGITAVSPMLMLP